jgi:hypothetical protein
MAHDLGFEVLLKIRDESPADPIALVAKVAVRFILAIGDPTSPEIGFDLPALDLYQRTDDQSVDTWGDASQTGGSASAHDPHENGFRLVGERMGGANAVGSDPPGRFPEEFVTALPGRLFDIQAVLSGICPDALPPHINGEPELPGRQDDEAFVFLGAAAETVVEMGDGKSERILLSKLQERGEKGHGIRAARTAHDNLVPSLEKAMMSDRLFDLRKEHRLTLVFPRFLQEEQDPALGGA